MRYVLVVKVLLQHVPREARGPKRIYPKKRKKTHECVGYIVFLSV